MVEEHSECNFEEEELFDRSRVFYHIINYPLHPIYEGKQF